MGCNCGKRGQESQSGPLGRGTSTSTSKPRDPVVPAAKPRPLGLPSSGTTGQTQSFALIAPDGQVTARGSRLEVDAARVRAGGKGQIRPV